MLASLHGLSRREIDGKIPAIIDFSGLEGYIDQPLRTYSAGMMIRLGFSTASHLEPDVLIVDEVLSAGDLAFQPYSKNRDEAINSVSRGALNMTLLDAAEKYDGVEIVFGHRCLDADLDAPSALFRDDETGAELERKFGRS